MKLRNDRKPRHHLPASALTGGSGILTPEGCHLLDAVAGDEAICLVPTLDGGLRSKLLSPDEACPENRGVLKNLCPVRGV
jgi:hypothetical protein